MAKRDGKNPKFRIMCRKCDSGMHTKLTVVAGLYLIECSNCGNQAANVDDEQKDAADGTTN